MGCAISKLHSRIIDSTRMSTSNMDIRILENASSLTEGYFDDCTTPKCVFIFGGSGSNKGEFIWELMQIRVTTESEEKVAPFLYHYIDAEDLIVNNIEKRIRKLTTEKSVIKSAKKSDDENGTRQKIDSSFSDIKTEDLKTTMLLYANIVTNNWVLGLVTKEIEKNVKSSKIFLINLIPNRINIFRNCLYLKQAPNFINFPYDYIAVNLIRLSAKRKDLDQMASNSNYDDVNLNFINYFRLINKLIDIKVNLNKDKIQLKVTKSKNAFPIHSISDLISFIKSPKKDGMEIDISEFVSEENLNNSLVFVVKNEIELDNDHILMFDQNAEIHFDEIRRFALVYLKIKELLQKE